MFKTTKNGDIIYIITKSDQISVDECKVLSVSPPHIDMKGQMLVDVTVMRGKDSKTYQIPEQLSTAYYETEILSTDSSEVVKIAEQTKIQCDDHLKKVPEKELMLMQAEEILKKYSPYFREKAEHDAVITSLRGEIYELKEMIKSLGGQKK